MFGTFRCFVTGQRAWHPHFAPPIVAARRARPRIRRSGKVEEVLLDPWDAMERCEAEFVGREDDGRGQHVAKLVPVRSPHVQLLPQPSEGLCRSNEAKKKGEGGLELRSEGFVRAPIPNHVVEWMKQMLEECHVAPEQPHWGVVRKKCKEVQINNRGHVVGMLREHIKRENYENAAQLSRECKPKLLHAYQRYKEGQPLAKLAGELGVGRATLGKMIAVLHMGKGGKALLKSAAKFLHSNQTSWQMAQLRELNQEEIQFLLDLAKQCEGDCITPLLDLHAQEAGMASEVELASRIRNNLEAVSPACDSEQQAKTSAKVKVKKSLATLSHEDLEQKAGSSPQCKFVGASHSLGSQQEDLHPDKRVGENIAAASTQHDITKEPSAAHRDGCPLGSTDDSTAVDPVGRTFHTVVDKALLPNAQGEASKEKKDALFAENVRDEAALRHPLQTTVTPDLLLTRPCMYDGVLIRWVESKSGLVVPGISMEQTVENLRKQLQNYCRYLGPGVVFWKKGYTQAVEELVPGVLHRTGAMGAFKEAQADSISRQCSSSLADFSFNCSRIMSYIRCK